MNYLWVALGSALGGVARYWCSGVAARLVGRDLPVGNDHRQRRRLLRHRAVRDAHGARTGASSASSEARVFVMVGLCGGYTTFSSFSLQSLALARAGEWAGFGMNIGLSVVLCLAAVWLGHAIAVAVNG